MVFLIMKSGIYMVYMVNQGAGKLARIFRESSAPTADMIVLPGVLGGRTLRRTVQVHLGSNSLRLPGGTLFSTVSRHRFVKYPGWMGVGRFAR
jgi:hypothetical protein